MKPLLVCKIGTSAITTDQGEIDEKILQSICDQLAELHQKYRLVVVSSGAVACGKKFLKLFSRKISEEKASAAIGNPILIGKYAEFFEPHGIYVAQSLCERHHFSDRGQFLQLRQTFEELWKNDIIPIVNENDVVSDRELKFSDNDELAVLMAVGFSAQKLLLGTSVEGLLNNGQLVPRINQFDEAVLGFADKNKSEAGRGGMISKLHSAKLATELGTDVVIFDIRKKGQILAAEQNQTGTVCPGRQCDLSAHNKWMASGSLTHARIIIDQGAEKAMRNRKSLLLVGVKKITGEFEKGEVLEIFSESDNFIAVARAKISAEELQKAKDKKGVEVANADDIVVF